MTSEVKIETQWTETRCESWDKLNEVINELVRHANGKPLGWRGQPNQTWDLETTFDRWSREHHAALDYAQRLQQERRLLKDFNGQACLLAGAIEDQYLTDDFGSPAVLNLLALGRHHGLPTRVLDWTQSSWVAGFFACVSHAHDDGAIWWFNQSQLEQVLKKKWDDFDVPTFGQLDRERDLRWTGTDPDHRAVHLSMFEMNAREWLTKIHYGPPFPKMEAQQGFMTGCGRIGILHDKAINDLSEFGQIDRGRIVIPSQIKEEVLSRLKDMNVHARSLEYPALDVLARKIRCSFFGDDSS